MYLIESKLQLQRQIAEAQALLGRIQQSQQMMRYYGTEEAPSTSELEAGVGYLYLVITSLQKQVTLLEESPAYKKEYGERYAIYQPEAEAHETRA